MYIIIVGGGQVGYHLAKALLSEGQEILVIEKDTQQAEVIEDELGSVCMQGDGCEISVLREAGIERADMLIAVTGTDADNLVACQLAKYKFNVPHNIARISNPQNDALFRKLGIDTIVSSAQLILDHIAREIPTHYFTRLLALQQAQSEIVAVKIAHNASVVGKRIRSISLPEESIPLLIVRKEAEFVMPSGDVTLQADDQLIAVINTAQEEALLKLLSVS